MSQVKRIYIPCFEKDSKKKALVITGPRQCGKTTAATMLTGTKEYFNYDLLEDRDIITQKSWNRTADYIIFDELHKMPGWKQFIKGLIDTENNNPSLIITGSTCLNTYKKFGESLAGRYFEYRMHPLDVREICLIDDSADPDSVFDKILRFSGFPEPFIEADERFYNKWKKTHLDIIIKQDIVSYESVRNIASIELLVDLLRKKVGSPISYISLAEDLKVSDKTVKHWLNILEEMFIIFKITPYHRNIARAVQKKPKYYFYDCMRVASGEGAKIENAVASSLLKECQFREDCLGETWQINYLSKRGGVEVDFLITKEGVPHTMIEVKKSDDSLSKNFSSFTELLPDVQIVQLVKDLRKEKTYPSGAMVRRAGSWLAKW